MAVVSKELADATLLTISGDAVAFSSLYADRPTMLTFVRHYGCIFCRERVGSIESAEPLLRANDMGVAVIGNGTAPMARAFSEEVGINWPLFTDPGRRVFELAGMRRNFGLGLKSVSQAWRSWRGGYRQGPVQGDPWQQGGILLIAPSGQILASQIDSGAGEYIDVEALIHGAANRLSA